MRKISVMAIALISLFVLNQKAEALHWPHRSNAPAPTANTPTSSSSHMSMLSSLGNSSTSSGSSKAALVAQFGEGIGKYAETKDPADLPPNLQQPVSIMCNNVCGGFTCHRYHSVGMGCQVLCNENQIQHCVAAMGQ